MRPLQGPPPERAQPPPREGPSQEQKDAWADHLELVLLRPRLERIAEENYRLRSQMQRLISFLADRAGASSLWRPFVAWAAAAACASSRGSSEAPAAKHPPPMPKCPPPTLPLP